MRLIATLIVMTTLASAAQADTFRALNRHEVNTLPSGDFEVIQKVGSGPTHIWCGAGDYAIRALRAPGVTRVYLVQGTAPSVTEPGRRAVTFSLRPPAGTADRTQVQQLFLSLKAVGDNLSAAVAQQYCYDHLGERNPRFP